MSVAKVTEIIASSNVSFEAAARAGIERAQKTLKGVSAAWIEGQKVVVGQDGSLEFRVDMKVTFVLEG